MNSIEKIINTLQYRKETIAVAESITGGKLAAALTSAPGSSKVFLGGIVAYSIESKVQELGIPKRLINKFGVYSEEIALEMANGVRKKFNSDWSIASTGVAGPGPAEETPAGSIWLVIIGPQATQNIRLSLQGSREEIRVGAVTSAVATLERILEQ
ncbi:MAG: CinA family protein [Actinobacteria bacterium]|nr:CinA family protein [Actinomycetota bacterium]